MALTVEQLTTLVETLQTELTTLKQEVKQYRQDILELEQQLSQSITTQNLVVIGKAKIVDRDVSQTFIDFEQKFKSHDDTFITHVADITAAQNTANSAVTAAGNAQNTANSGLSGLSSLQSGIQDGSIIAAKAVMLRARNDDHWMRFNTLDASNHDVFMLWRTDNTFHPTIRVQASDKLLARNDAHWMRYKGTNASNQGYQLKAGHLRG